MLPSILGAAAVTAAFLTTMIVVRRSRRRPIESECQAVDRMVDEGGPTAEVPEKGPGTERTELQR